MGCGCPSESQDCTCPVKDLSTDCILYNGTVVLSHIGTNPNTLGTQVLININQAFSDLKDSLPSYFQLGNIGNGALIFSGISGTGIRQLRSIVQGTNIIVTENTSDIQLDVPSASTTVLGSIEIATQAEVDAAADALKAVTPSTLGVFTSEPANLPSATETSEGIVERATAAETLALTDTARFITPFTLSGLIASTAEVNALSITDKFVTPGRLPIASTTQQGLVELATAAEANALSDLLRPITPGTIPIASQTQQGISELASVAEANALSDLVRPVTPGTLPIASDTQQGLAERATSTEANAGVDNIRFITPFTMAAYVSTPTNLPNATETDRGIIEIATQAEVDAEADSEKAVVPSTLASYVDSKIGVGTTNNIGSFGPIDYAASGNPASVTGTLASVVHDSTNSDSEIYLVTLNNAMSNTGYLVRSFLRSNSEDLRNATGARHIVWRPISTTQFYIVISETLANTQNVTVFLEVVDIP